MSSQLEIEVLSLACKKLDDAGIPYMVTGSFAGNFYTVPRMTRDLDVVIELDQFNKGKLFKVFEKDFYLSEDAMTDAITHESMFNAIHQATVFKIDFIVRKNAIYRKTEFKRRLQKELDNQPIWVVAPEDLILSKLDWAKDSLSQMQINDIKNLLTSVSGLDESYIIEWVQKLNLDEIYGKIHG